MQSFTVKIPLRIVSTPNRPEHWATRARRTKKHRGTAFFMTVGLALGIHPMTVKITRIAPRMLDDDNNVSGCKAVRDGIADRLGINDRDPRVKWRYAQAKGKPKEYAVLVEAEEIVAPVLVQTGERTGAFRVSKVKS